MNNSDDIRVSIHCYEGDADQVRAFLPYHFLHECPVTIISPVDSPVCIPGEDNRYAGYRQSAGQLSLDRQRDQMKLLLTYPENLFLMHDADSICLSPVLPAYLSEEPNVLWSNLVYNDIPEQAGGYPPGTPRLAFQPPYFLSRSTIERLLAVADQVTVNPKLPYIDHYMVQLAVASRVSFKGFPDGISMAICTHPGFLEKAQVEVKHKGRVFIHSVKGPKYLAPLLSARQEWLDSSRKPGDLRPLDNPDTTRDVGPRGLMRAHWQGDKLIYSGENR